MVDDDGPVGLDGVRVVFDDDRVVSDAGIALVATLAARLGIESLAQRLVRLRPGRPGASSAGRKVIALIYAMPTPSARVLLEQQQSGGDQHRQHYLAEHQVRADGDVQELV